jgi:ATP-dependent Clp protease protease subunit
VDKALAEKVIRQLLILEAESDAPIKIMIDSPGGDVDAGYAIFDMIRFVKPKVITVGMGLVASAGALILLASPKDDRVGLPN